jgi:hypothetical protein
VNRALVSRVLRIIAALLAVSAATAVLLTGLAAGADAARTAVLGDPATPSTSDSRYYRSTVSAIEPAVPGLSVRMQPSGELTLTNTTGRTVTLLGYDGEPFLRITSQGVDENVNSLSAALGATWGSGSGSDWGSSGVDGPHWRHRDSGKTVTWHDYRTRAATGHRPPAVAAHPHQQQRVRTWALQLTVGNQPVAVQGAVDWTGAPRFTHRQLALLVIAGVVVLGLAILLVAQLIDRRAARRAEPAPELEASADGADRSRWAAEPNPEFESDVDGQADRSSRSRRAARSQFTRSPDLTPQTLTPLS